MAKENREYKDSVFVDLFYRDEDAKKNLLELHNALYGTAYTDPEIIKLIGLENTLFQNFKNDVAFSVDDRKIVLSEHQSTVNPNMPLRDLMYIAREYEKIIPVRARYKTSLMKIPVPEFVVFYNGKRDYPPEEILRLSDAFLVQEKDVDLELKVHVININASVKHPILERCKVLRDYSLFVETTRKFEHTEDQLQKAVRECINNDILKDYLLRKSNEVINMLIAEYSYETDMEVKIEEATEELRKEAALEIEKAKKEAEESEKARKEEEKKREEEEKKRKEEEKKRAEEEKKREEAEKMFVDVVDNVMEMYQISAEQACERISVPFERYKAIKKSIDGKLVK